MSIAGFLGFGQNLILFLILFGVLVFIHEFGHFIVAKAVGVGVEKFFLGFGPKMFSFRKGETEYGVNWILLGGFVKLMGDEINEQNDIPKDKSFMGKPPLARIAVVSAGPISNFLLPIILFAFLFFVGIPSLGPYVGEVVNNSPAEKAGLLQGDKVLAVNGAEVKKWDDLTGHIRDSEGKEISLSIEREGKIKEIPVEPRKSRILNIFREKVDGWTIGITPYQYEPAIGIVDKNSIAYKSGLRTGDVIRELNGNKIKYYWQFEKLYDEQSNELNFLVDREVDTKRKDSTLTVNAGLLKEKEGLGIYPSKYYLLRGAPLSVAILEGSLAYESGLRNGDTIKSIDSIGVKSFEDIKKLSKSKKIFKVLYSRSVDNVVKSIEVGINLRRKLSLAKLGVYPSQLFISYVKPSSIAAEKGVKPGDMLTSIDGKKANNWMDLEKKISDNQGEAIKISLLRSGKKHTISITPRITMSEDHVTGASQEKRELGIEPMMAMMTPATIEYVEQTYNPIKALYLGASKTYMILATQVIGFVKLIRGSLSVKHIGGPILIYKLAGRSFEMGGLLSFISYIALLSIVLGFVNLLPIPIMDGGHIVFYTIEIIKRKPLSLKTREIAQQIGFVLVIGLMILATYNDIKRYFFTHIAEFFKNIF